MVPSGSRGYVPAFHSEDTGWDFLTPLLQKEKKTFWKIEKNKEKEKV